MPAFPAFCVHLCPVSAMPPCSNLKGQVTFAPHPSLGSFLTCCTFTRRELKSCQTTRGPFSPSSSNWRGPSETQPAPTLPGSDVCTATDLTPPVQIQRPTCMSPPNTSAALILVIFRPVPSWKKMSSIWMPNSFTIKGTTSSLTSP